MKDIKIVLGSNYGDEGKGLATHFFSQQAANENKLCLNVLFNGGPQRGHTVELKNGFRHVFHHFGSGTVDGAHTYFHDEFMLNPMVFRAEYDELYNLNVFVDEPTVYCSPYCRVITPFDMLINQILEISRGDKKHGSCGHGIWETETRYKSAGGFHLTYKQLIKKSNDDLFDYLKRIYETYMTKKLVDYGVHLSDIGENDKYAQYRDLFYSEDYVDGLIRHYISDLRFFEKHARIITMKQLFTHYDTIVFEAGQGLALDEANKLYYPHVTASSTTSKIPMTCVNDLIVFIEENRRKLSYDFTKTLLDIEICYVTRSYFTRHGVGYFPTECAKSDINSAIEDKTNIHNDFQDSIRYGRFSSEEFLFRVCNDYNIARNLKVRPSFATQLRSSMFVTHLNYCDEAVAKIFSMFRKVYKSYTPFAEDVE